MVLRGQLQRGKNSGGGWEGQWWWLSFEVYDQWHFRLMICYPAFSDRTNRIRDKYYLIILYLKSTWIPCRKERLGTGCNQSLSVLNIWKCWWTHRLDCGLWSWSVLRISGLDRSWSGPISVFFQSSNWTFKHYKSPQLLFFPYFRLFIRCICRVFTVRNTWPVAKISILSLSNQNLCDMFFCMLVPSCCRICS